MEIQQIIGGIDFEREIKAAMRLAGYLKLGDAVIITDQDHRILILMHIMNRRQGIPGTVSLGSKLDS
ncbi:hypothetical protein [Peribacillus frigoritolerans]|uniref:Uncharacterized protein n=1 Tax=Peribacillus frigoritolerans TaxID=450367 RepID=A0AAJ1QK38_9BACI|nr:hypothetical protein [Peribacillus frigoritolerans]MDM5282876.1 hypothetical protein [Peribacillus frigoritolerans]